MSLKIEIETERVSRTQDYSKKNIDRLFIIDLLIITKQWHKSKIDDNFWKKKKK